MSINLSINLPTSTPSHNASETGQAGELKRPAPMTRFLSLPTLSHDGGSRPVAKARLKVWKPLPPNNPQIALRRAVQRVVARVKTCRQQPPGAGRLADADRSETARRILNRFLQQLPGSPCTEPFTRALVSQTAVVKKPRMQTGRPTVLAVPSALPYAERKPREESHVHRQGSRRHRRGTRHRKNLKVFSLKTDKFELL